eukprot:43251-Chlamydomonas_euryale.AAC.11
MRLPACRPFLFPTPFVCPVPSSQLKGGWQGPQGRDIGKGTTSWLAAMDGAGVCGGSDHAARPCL